MENFQDFNKKTNYQRTNDQYLQYNTKIYSNPSNISQKYGIASYQQKDPFLRYASSVIQVRNQEEQKYETQPVYEQSQLINPAPSLIEKYQTVKKQYKNKEQISSRNSYKKIQNQRILQKGIQILQHFIIRYQRKKHEAQQKKKKKDKNPESLIDILALSSVENLNQLEFKLKLGQSFGKIKKFKTYNLNINKIDKNTKPNIPNFKKTSVIPPIQTKSIQIIQKSQNDYEKLTFSKNKKQGTDHLVGVLTFKVLLLESQTFSIIKKNIQIKKFQRIIHQIEKICSKITFHKIKTYFPLDSQKLDSKILTLSKSKSKGSLSKLKFHNYISNTQKKIIHKLRDSRENEDLDSQNNFNEKVISSQIIENFDFHQLKQKIDPNIKDKKMGFNNKIKKKSTKESSQAQTVNSKRSIQSEYQFVQGVNSKVDSYQKPNSAKNFGRWDDNSNQYNLQEIPTQKMINLKRYSSRQIFQYERDLFPENIHINKPLNLIPKEQRRYLNVRTNLYELPILSQKPFKQSFTKKDYKSQQMNKIYHLLPLSLIKSEPLQDLKDSFPLKPSDKLFSKSLKSINSQKQMNIYKDLIDQQQEKNKKLKTHKQKQKDRLENYYLGTQKNQQKDHKQIYYNYRPQGTENKLLTPEDKTLKKSKSHQLVESLLIIDSTPSVLNKHQVKQNLLLQSSHHNFHQQSEVHQNKKPHKLKLKSLTSNFEDYYTKRETKERNETPDSLNFEKQMSSLSKSKILRPVVSKIQRLNTQTSARPQNQLNYLQTEYKPYQHHFTQQQIKYPIDNKSVSPPVKFVTKQSYRTGKSGSKYVQQFNPVENNLPEQRVHSPSFVVMNKNNQFVQNFNNYQNHKIMAIQNKSKLKHNNNNHSQSPKPLSPKQSNLIQHLFTGQSSQRKNSFIVMNNKQNNIHQPLTRPPSNSNFIPLQSTNFTPTNSNLSNNRQSFHNNNNMNVNRVINYGLNTGIVNQNNFVNNQQFLNRPSSILSTHSNQSKQKVLSSSKPTTGGINMAKRNPHMISKPQLMFNNINSLRSNNGRIVQNKTGNIQQQQMYSPQQRNYPQAINYQISSGNCQNHQQVNQNVNSPRRGLNVMMSNPSGISIQQRQSPNISLNKQNQRNKSISNQKLFVMPRK